MRFAALNLLKYGQFDGTSFELPTQDADIHIVYGDNEAGKSTTLSALEDLLFEFPQGSTPYSYVHPTKALRVGAILQHDGESFEFLRRKGRSGNTIVAGDGQSIPDGEKILATFLQGVDKAFFQRMFFLDHSRLRRGADDLLAESADAGQALLASGAGIPGLAEILTAYDVRADGLWAKAKSKKRSFYQVSAKLSEAQEAQRAALVNVSAYKAKKRAYEDTLAAYDEASEAVQTLQARQLKLGRIRRVHRDVVALLSAQDAIAALGDIMLLPAGAETELDAAQQALDKLGSRRAVYEERIKQRQAHIDTLPVDEALLQRAGDIESLNETRVTVRESRDDLPRRIEDLEAVQSDIASLAQELGWSLEKVDAISLLPPTPVISKARSLVTASATLEARKGAANTALGKAARKASRLREQSTDSAELADAGPLRVAYAAAQDDHKVTGLREAAEGQRDRAMTAINGLLDGLSPAVQDAKALRSMAVPNSGAIESFGDELAELQRKREELGNRLEQLSEAIYDDEQFVKEKRESQGALSDEDIRVLRERRDLAWSLIANRHINDADVSDQDWASAFGEDASGQEQYESLVGEADEGADDRFRHAGTVALVNEAQNRIDTGRARVKNIETALQDLDTQQSALDDAWSALWAESGVAPGSVDQMTSWSNAREAIIERLAEFEEANVDIERHTTKEETRRTALLQEMIALGSETKALVSASLVDVLAAAKEVGRDIAEALKAADAKNQALDEADDDVAEKQADFDAVALDVSAWSTQWQAVLKDLRLGKDTLPDDVEAFIGLIEKTRQLVDEADSIQRDRIDKMTRDIRSYESQTKVLVKAVADDLADALADDAVHALMVRVQTAKSNRDKCLEAQADIDTNQEHLDELAEDEQKSQEVISELHRQSSTKSMKALIKATKQSEELRELQEEAAQLTETLEKDGDERSIDELTKEVQGVDLDEVMAEAGQLSSDVEAHMDALTPLRDEMIQAKAELDAIGASGDAAAAASRIKYAHAELETIAESFIRARAAERLLRWGIDYSRRTKQGPLLKKASGLFSTVTGGRYESLVVEYDDDKPVLAGVDKDGDQKGIEAMSDGTLDQLYLALRLAAVDDYIDRATPMPFVIDDIFVNFDDNRTGFGISALEVLSKRCQVIIFTHHARLVEIAQSTLATPPTIITLT